MVLNVNGQGIIIQDTAMAMAMAMATAMVIQKNDLDEFKF